jgi:uncharacterized RDD family membrane protein YckC
MADEGWYYLKDEGAQGPATAEELESLVREGTIPQDTLVWRLGQDTWQPLAELFPSIVTGPAPPPFPGVRSAPEPSQQREPFLPLVPRASRSDATGGVQWIDRRPHPWRRYLARTLDETVNGAFAWCVIGIIVYVLWPANADSFFSMIGDNKALNAMLTVVAAIPMNALLIGFTGGSLGKWLFGVKVVDADGEPLGIRTAIWRECVIGLKGLGLGIPIVALFTCWSAYKTLSETGSTTWDKQLAVEVVYRPHGPRQVAGVTAGVLTWLVAVGCLAALSSV